ncbi:MAG: hypothetical protein KKA36_05325, partial [Gammaproteobacteria bacterium]|nr:hypothetical protein [Gammaproteobacteria bacterium]
MSEAKVYPVPATLSASTLLDAAGYKKMYQRSVDDPEGFWAEQANQLLTW